MQKLDSQMLDVSEAVLNSITEEQMAEWRGRQGTQVLHHRGRYWKQVHPGFYQPIHLIARLSAEQATPPSLLHWGFRSALCEDDTTAANGSVAVHLLTDVKAYDLQSLPRHRRTHLRKCHKLVRIVQLIEPTLLQEQGYEVVLSALQRTKHQKPPSRESYLANLAAYTTDTHKLVLAGLIGDKLGGYMEGYAVGETAYIDNIYIATEALPTSIGTGFIFEFVQACHRAGNIREVVYGQHSREDAALCLFKEEMRFLVKHIPSKVQINPLIGEFIRRQRPDAYYRLTGHD